jgi:hypothetical protein
MLDLLFTTTASDTLTLGNTLSVLASSLILGFFISITYIQTHKKEGHSPTFSVTLIMLPIIIAVIILLVGNNVARAFSLAGAFSLIRFRSAPGDPKDIAYVFFTLAVGLACGMGYISYAALFAAVLCLTMVVVTITGYGRAIQPKMQLKITIPEDLDHSHLFDDLFQTYLKSYQLVRVKSTNFGSLFELKYNIIMNDNDQQKMFIDELRKRNGNLNIIINWADNEPFVEI